MKEKGQTKIKPKKWGVNSQIFGSGFELFRIPKSEDLQPIDVISCKSSLIKIYILIIA